MKKISVVSFVVAGISICFAVFLLPLKSLPEPETFTPSLFAKADTETWASEKVFPGTFKIKISLKDLSDKVLSTEKPLAVYNTSDDNLRIDYWLVREGGGIIYHAQEEFSPKWSGFWHGIKEVKIQDGHIIAMPKPSFDTRVFFFCIAGMSALCGGLCSSPNKKTSANKPKPTA